MKKLIVFDGEKHLEITGKEIDQLDPEKLVELFKSTAALSDVVRDITPAIKAKVVTAICGYSVDEQYSDNFFDGFVTLRLQLDVIFGEDSASAIAKDIMSNFKNE